MAVLILSRALVKDVKEKVVVPPPPPQEPPKEETKTLIEVAGTLIAFPSCTQ